MFTDATPTPPPQAQPADAGALLNPAAPAEATDAPPATDAYFVALRLLRTNLPHARGLDYKAFRAGLEPRWGQVWRDLLPAHAAIALTLAGLAWAQAQLPLAAAVALAAGGAFALGALVHYVVLFLHEAAHHGLHPDRATNDRLGYAFCGILIGADMATYRASHFDHHRHLGEPSDTEHSYFEAPAWGRLLATLTGIRTVHVALRRRYIMGATAAAAPARPWALLGGLMLHGALLGGLLLAGAWLAAASWVLAMGAVFPMVGEVRQTLEHRAEAASAAVDYARVPHGATSRLFGDGPLARFFGAAGFNRHLLHHFEPAVSYTRLGELEAYLRETPLAPYLASRTTTYYQTFKALMRRR